MGNLMIPAQIGESLGEIAMDHGLFLCKNHPSWGNGKNKRIAKSPWGKSLNFDLLAGHDGDENSYFFSKSCYATVDGRVDIRGYGKYPIISVFLRFQVVQEFFHQPYFVGNMEIIG